MTIMDKEQEKKKKKKKKQHLLVYKLISFLLVVLTFVSIGYVFYQDILPLSYLIIGSLGVLLVVYLNTFILTKTKLRIWFKNIFAFFSIILIIAEGVGLFFGTKTFDFIESITDTGTRITEYGVYVLKSSNYKKIKDLNDKTIYYLSSDDEKKLNSALDSVKKDISFNSDDEPTLEELVNSFNDNSCDAMLLDSSYEDILREEYEDTYKNLKLIKTYKIKTNVNVLKSNKNITQDTFVMYVSGIDTSGNVASSARSDVNLLIGVNPKTHQILLVNTPRDYYVKLHTKQKMDKLTHAGIYGVEESLNTLADLYDTEIDYYARINFTSFIKLVDALDGVTVDIPKDFCEQNSKRSFESKDLICLKKGNRTLKGEQALAYARNRHAFADGDRARGEHQMEIVKAIINKAISPKIITKYTSLLNALDGRMTTNMDNSDITKFIKKQIRKNSSWNFTTMSATGSDSSGVCYSTGSGKAYVMKPNEDSVNAIKQAFKNLANGEENIMPQTETTTTVKK